MVDPADARLARALVAGTEQLSDAPIELRFRRSDGSTMVAQTRLAWLRDAAGRVVETVASVGQ
jgi:hypothetical protein